MKIALLILLISLVSGSIIALWPAQQIIVETINSPLEEENFLPIEITKQPKQEPKQELEEIVINKPEVVIPKKEEKIKTVEEAAFEEGEPRPKGRDKLPPEIPINLKSIVALRCVFINPYNGSSRTAFGSGAIISDDGIILTARHMVDTDYILNASGGKQGFYGYQFDHCDVGPPKDSTNTPTIQQIRNINPFYVIDVLPYTARLEFLPNDIEFSGAEKALLDTALIKIVGLSEDAKAFGITELPASFSYSTLLSNVFPKEGDEIVTFGFPSGAPDSGSYFRLQGSVGEVKIVLGGDEYFRNKPVEIQSLMETIGGRSGSPVFWRGYVVGVVSFKEDNSINAFSTSIIPLLQVLP